MLFISGCTDGATLKADAMPTPAAYLAKPFSRSELEEALEALRART